MTVGVPEILLILFVVLLVIGPRRIVDMGRSLGRAVHDFTLELDHDKKPSPRIKKTTPTEADSLRISDEE
jgi:sec-independent protein translocase protein TatA